MPPTVLLLGTDRGLLTQPLPMTPDRPELAAYIYETDPDTRPFQPRCTRHHAQERVPRCRGALASVQARPWWRAFPTRSTGASRRDRVAECPPTRMTGFSIALT